MHELDKAQQVALKGPEADAALDAVGRQHSFTGRGPALLLEVSTPCVVEDNYFADPAIPIGGNHQRRQP